VLFFDEADALFGKRSEVRDSHDRYANIEVAYLLQQIETFNGITILATNLRANVDDAFTRRLDVIVEFPLPDEIARRQLWDHCLGAIVPRDENLDLNVIARSFELSGGNIRKAALAAAYRAAELRRAVTLGDLMASGKEEYQKIGRLYSASSGA
jgi:SpoVK/Ycf46/Vps4 family AAA+-type ATPase